MFFIMLQKSLFTLLAPRSNDDPGISIVQLQDLNTMIGFADLRRRFSQWRTKKNLQSFEFCKQIVSLQAVSGDY